MTDEETVSPEEFAERLERVHAVLGGDEDPKSWLADEMGRTYQAVRNWTGGRNRIPEYALSYLDLLEDVARLQAEAEIDLPENERVRREYRDLLRKIRAIKTKFETVARGYYVKLTELEEELEDLVDPHFGHRQEQFGDRVENELEAQTVAKGSGQT